MSFIKFIIGAGVVMGIAEWLDSGARKTEQKKNENKPKAKVEEKPEDNNKKKPSIKANRKVKVKAKSKSKVKKPPPQEKKIAETKNSSKTAEKIDKVESVAKEYPHSFFINTPENASQFPNVDSKEKPEQVFIGFDFGTSSAKVIIQLPYSTGTPAFAVPFGRFADPNLKYLLPTRIFIEPQSGTCSLKAEDSHYIELADIKAGLMSNPDAPIQSVNNIKSDIPVKYIATAYLALVLRYVRCWFLAEKENIYGKKSLVWSVNLGLPAAKDDDEVRNDFEVVGKAAWMTSLDAGAITIDNVKKIFKEVRKKYMSDDNFVIDFRLLPEVIAEAHGYAQTKHRRDGLHILVDAGATTLDINGFKLFKEGTEDKYSIICADVANWGAVPLHKERIKALEDIKDGDIHNHLKGLKLSDTTQIIPSNFDAYLPASVSKKPEYLDILKSVDNDFIRNKAFYNYLATMLNLLRVKRNPYLIDWTEVEELRGELPVILCGGASAMPAYQDLIEKQIRPWVHQYVAASKNFDIRLIKVKKPENLSADIDDESFHRLAVAWGLSHPEFDIGEYFLPSEIDIEREPAYKKDENFVDSSQV